MATSEELKRYEAFFDHADADKSGYLTIQELKKCLKNSGFDDQTIVDMFVEFDKDGDRQVTKAEFLGALGRLPPSRLDEAKLRKAFKDIDRDGSGTLDAAEIKRALSSCGTKISDATAERIIKEVDRDGDGKVNINEFLALFRNQS
ncbi:uncharacterized protein [Haliotis asinina]|uniref:uncharacterized protein n=1 Tax=Haliotis asinina TaxID=109174 RepID=UPI0035324E7A